MNFNQPVFKKEKPIYFCKEDEYIWKEKTTINQRCQLALLLTVEKSLLWMPGPGTQQCLTGHQEFRWLPGRADERDLGLEMKHLVHWNEEMLLSIIQTSHGSSTVSYSFLPLSFCRHHSCLSQCSPLSPAHTFPVDSTNSSSSFR